MELEAFKEIDLTEHQMQKALELGEGGVFFSYTDGENFYLETIVENAPFKWNGIDWERMLE